MTHQVLTRCLKPIVEAESRWQRRKLVGYGLGIGAVILGVLAVLASLTGWWSTPLVLIVFASSLITIPIGLLLLKQRRVDLRKLAERVEAEHPDLNSLLLTAMDLETGERGKLGYLQSEVLGQVTEHAIRNRWVRQVSDARVKRAGWMQFFAIAAFFVSAWFVLGQVPGQTRVEIVDTDDPAAPAPLPTGIALEVKPGDVEVEKGSRLVVEAHFTGRIPRGALVILTDPVDGSERGRLPMRPGLDDSVFSSIVESVDSDTKYRVRFEEETSDDFTISVFEHPELVQADAVIANPAYAGGGVREIEDTRKISVLEGSRVDWKLQVNKPVAFAELFGEDQSIIELKPTPGDKTVLVASHLPEKSQKYRLHLVDRRERANKRPPWFTITVKKNQPPRLEFTFPTRDIDVSPVEELAVEATVWDDVGVQRAGITFSHQGKNRDVILADEVLPGEKEHALDTLLAIEELEAEPRDLITYHLWAEDLDREGRTRRSQSDMFLAEVRHFEDIFREQASQGGQGQAGAGNESEELLKIQKDILNGSWKVLREAHLGQSPGKLGDDISVLRESQIIAIGKTDQAVGRVEDPILKAHFLEAREKMDEAVEHFSINVDPFDDGEPDSKTLTEPLELAHASVRSAYESLIKARSREHSITQSNEPSQGQGSQQQQQLMNLELKQKDLKYKENTSAQSPEEQAEQKENLEVLNKLKELARRQEAIAKKIKELQNQLEEAQTEEEKEQIRRQLKRLQEEQESLLREVDDLSQKMDSEENRSRMAEERKKLDEIRENIREASEKLEEEELADAANSATRAQRELEEVEDEFRKKTSHQFAEEMKAIRQSARDLAETQEAISEALNEKAPEGTNSGNYFERPEENAELYEQLTRQQEKLEDLIEQMKEMSEEAEVSEPLLSDKLYDAVREAMVNGVEESLEEASRMVRFNRRNGARDPEQNAARGIENIREKVELAAESILGSEADSLRLARAELDRLIEQSQREAERLENQESGDEESPRPGNGEAREPGREKGQGQPADRGEEGSIAANGNEASPGEQPKGKGPGKGEKGAGAKGEGEEPGSEGEKGSGESQMADGKSKGQGARGEEGQQAGKGGKGDSPEMAGDPNARGKAPGKGKGKGQPGEGEQPGPGQEGQQDGDGQMADSQRQGKGKGQTGRGQPSNQDSRSNDRNRSLLSQGNPGGRRSVGSNFGGDDRGSRLPTGFANNETPLFFDQAGEMDSQPAGPITGEEFKDFANSLGSIEEMVGEEQLRNEVAKVLDNARGLRVDYKRDNLPPGAAEIRMKIVNPLVELRSRVSEEIAKLNRENPLAPIDRDPVPGDFRELVRQYYEQLGAGN